MQLYENKWIITLKEGKRVNRIGLPRGTRTGLIYRLVRRTKKKKKEWEFNVKYFK